MIISEANGACTDLVLVCINPVSGFNLINRWSWCIIVTKCSINITWVVKVKFDSPRLLFQLADTTINGVALVFYYCDALCVVGRLVSRKSLCRVCYPTVTNRRIAFVTKKVERLAICKCIPWIADSRWHVHWQSVIRVLHGCCFITASNLTKYYLVF